jgi:hypothetical protein
VREMLQAIASGKRVWATVLRRGGIRLVPGSEVRDDELLSWTYEGATSWTMVGLVVWKKMGDADEFLGN